MGYDGKVVFKVDLDTKDFVPQIEQTKKELDDLLEEYEEIQKPLIPGEQFVEGGKAAKYEKEQLTKLAAQIQETANKYIDLKKKQDEVYKGNVKSVKNIGMMDNAMYNKSYALQYNQLGTAMANVKGQLPYIAEGFKDIGKEVEETGVKAQKTGKEAEKTGKTFDKSFNKGLKSVKKLAMGIIGVRSAYMLARRAASAYMAQDEDLAKSMQSVWTGLGAFLAPLLEMLSQLMLKFVGYLNVFIRELTGRDLISEANAKIIEKQRKAQEKLNKATKEYLNYDFDVIRTQQTPKNNEEFKIDESELINIPELNQNVVKKLEDLAKWLKENKELIEQVGIALGITFGAIAIAKILENIGMLIGSGALMTGLLGLLAVLGMLAIVWQIKFVIDNLDELHDALDTAKELREYLVENTPEQYNSPQGGISPNAQSYGYLYESMRAADSIRNSLSGLSGGFYKAISGLGDTTYKDLQEELRLTYKEMGEHVKGLIETAKQGKLTTNGYKQLTSFVSRYGDKIEVINKYIDGEKISTKELNNVINEFSETYSNASNEISNMGNVSQDTKKQIDRLVDSFLQGEITIEDFINQLNKIPKETKTTMKADTKEATKNTKDYKNTIDSVPNKKDTKMNADEKTAMQKVDEYATVLRRLPLSVVTKLGVEFDVNDILEALRQKLRQNPSAYNLLKNSIFGKVLGFAHGGLVTQPTMAMIGEAGYNEYVVPETDDYIGRLANLIGQYGSGGGTTNVYLDGRLIQRQVDNTRSRVDFMKNK